MPVVNTRKLIRFSNRFLTHPGRSRVQISMEILLQNDASRHIHTFRIYSGTMTDRAKIFKSGGSQAVRLPKEYRFDGQDSVLIYRQGRRVILESEQPSWSQEFLDLAGSAGDFPYPEEPPEPEPGPDFD